MSQYSQYVENLQQHSSYDKSVLKLVKNLEVCPGLVEFLRVSALEVSNFILTRILLRITLITHLSQKFCAILSLWEPQFHPMIREVGNMQKLLVWTYLCFPQFLKWNCKSLCRVTGKCSEKYFFTWLV
jgi:hypothetical protein